MKYFRVWYDKGEGKKCIVVQADTGKEARIIVKQKYGNVTIGCAWRINI